MKTKILAMALLVLVLVTVCKEFGMNPLSFNSSNADNNSSEIIKTLINVELTEDQLKNIKGTLTFIGMPPEAQKIEVYLIPYNNQKILLFAYNKPANLMEPTPVLQQSSTVPDGSLPASYSGISFLDINFVVAEIDGASCYPLAIDKNTLVKMQNGTTVSSIFNGTLKCPNSMLTPGAPAVEGPNGLPAAIATPNEFGSSLDAFSQEDFALCWNKYTQDPQGFWNCLDGMEEQYHNGEWTRFYKQRLSEYTPLDYQIRYSLATRFAADYGQMIPNQIRFSDTSELSSIYVSGTDQVAVEGVDYFIILKHNFEYENGTDPSFWVNTVIYVRTLLDIRGPYLPRHYNGFSKGYSVYLTEAQIRSMQNRAPLVMEKATSVSYYSENWGRNPCYFDQGTLRARLKGHNCGFEFSYIPPSQFLGRVGAGGLEYRYYRSICDYAFSMGIAGAVVEIAGLSLDGTAPSIIEVGCPESWESVIVNKDRLFGDDPALVARNDLLPKVIYPPTGTTTCVWAYPGGAFLYTMVQDPYSSDVKHLGWPVAWLPNFFCVPIKYAVYWPHLRVDGVNGQELAIQFFSEGMFPSYVVPGSILDQGNFCTQGPETNIDFEFWSQQIFTQTFQEETGENSSDRGKFINAPSGYFNQGASNSSEALHAPMGRNMGPANTFVIDEIITGKTCALITGSIRSEFGCTLFKVHEPGHPDDPIYINGSTMCFPFYRPGER